ncbi:glycosyltransferase [uncultured Rothia sp.]|uniref:glycosyltransferase n=1 Tax=uncultured Rothia sp. TaxID=316088 RepID=UPI003217B10A
MALLSIPSEHPYVRSIYPRAIAHDVPVLDDPILDPAEPARWWPHPAFERQWWENDTADTPRHLKDSITAVHVHFGFEHLSVEQTQDFIDTLRDQRIPLILTVHDIDNPHLADQSDYHRQLAILLGDAARIFTLTELAKNRLVTEFSVRAARIRVAPHPRVVPSSELPAPAAGEGVGVFLKSVRSNVIHDFTFYRDIAAECAKRSQSFRVFIHRDQAESELFRQLESYPGIELIAHDEMSDSQLYAAVAGCAAVILPYRGGTHSGWLEMCRDLDVPVAVPDCGCFAGQADSADAVRVFPTGDGHQAGIAATELAQTGHIPFAGNRDAQQKEIVALHRHIYEALLGPSLNIALIGPARFPIKEPYAGGLEAFCALIVEAFRSYGHRVDFYAAQGSEGNCPAVEFPGVNWEGHEDDQTDHTYPPGEREKEDAVFKQLREHLEADLAAGRIDVIHNNSLHPEFFGTAVAPSMVTTLHTPMLDDLQESIDEGVQTEWGAGLFAAVSAVTASTWNLPTPACIIPNGIDDRLWKLGPGGERAIWFGRITPEKGPHFAIDAARQLGLPLTLVGRLGTPRYFEEEIRPRLGEDIELLGSTSQSHLNELVGASAVSFVTPQWDEPFGMVVIESMACGTPAVSFARGGIPVILSPFPQLLVEPQDGADGLARAARQALTMNRQELSDWARSEFNNRRLVERYTALFAQVIGIATEEDAA